MKAPVPPKALRAEAARRMVAMCWNVGLCDWVFAETHESAKVGL